MTSSLEIPEIDTTWEHIEKKTRYVIYDITNLDTHDTVGFPPMVSYRCLKSGKKI